MQKRKKKNLGCSRTFFVPDQLSCSLKSLHYDIEKVNLPYKFLIVNWDGDLDIRRHCNVQVNTEMLYLLHLNVNNSSLRLMSVITP